MASVGRNYVDSFIPTEHNPKVTNSRYSPLKSVGSGYKDHINSPHVVAALFVFSAQTAIFCAFCTESFGV